MLLVLVLAMLALGYSIVGIATREAGREVVRVAGISESQEIFGGIAQAGDRLGPSDAPISIQVFNDLQCSSCRADFLGTIPQLVEDEVRPGNAMLLMRHYSVAQTKLELGFFAAEAAAQQGYGWQYTYLFFRNQDEAGPSASATGSSSRWRGRSANSTCRNGRNTSMARVARAGRSRRRLKATRNLARNWESARARR